jgi:hypothetical protein
MKPRPHALRILVLAAAFALSACGGGNKPEPTVAPLERPTSTPRPTVTPQPKPTDAPQPTSAPEPTATPKAIATPKTIDTPTGTDIADVVITGLEDYAYPSGLFTIKAPTDWTSKDTSGKNGVFVTWSDKANNGLIGVLITENASKLSQDELSKKLQDFVDTSNQEPDFQADPPEKLKSGGVLIVWSYTATTSTGTTAKLLVNSFIYQDKNKLSIIMFGVPNAQFETLKPYLNDVLNSYIVDPTVALAEANTAMDDLPSGVRYDFSDDTGKWVTEKTDAVEAELADGIYTLRIISPDQYYQSNPKMDSGTDQGIAASVQPKDDARAGVFLRLTKTDGKRDYYACWINAAGEYGCFVSIKDEWTTLQDATPSDAIKTDAPNRLVMTAKGDTITLRINGTEVATLTDSQVTEGIAGLYLENFKDPVEATYDDVTIDSK